jgi:ABC-type methionine transport system ATPase subunit
VEAAKIVELIKKLTISQSGAGKQSPIRVMEGLSAVASGGWRILPRGLGYA